MRDQLDLITTTAWDVLVILDACRADALNTLLSTQRCPGGGLNSPGSAGCCRSPAVSTPGWLRAVGPHLASLRPIYFSANPVVSREVEELGLDLCVLSAWKSLWGEHTRLRIPSVHPQAVTGLVSAYLSDMDNHRFIVHYIQPHSPFIGEPPLALARWGRGKGEFWEAAHRLTQPGQAVQQGIATWLDVRDAYMGNLRLVWEAVLVLASLVHSRRAEARIVVTADHGELLGEDGRFGHESGWRHEKLFAVPWVELSEQPSASTDQQDTQQKLEALGYA